MSFKSRKLDRVAVAGNLRAQFGLGISLGLIIGLLPKDSILPWAIGLCTLLAPVNLGATLIALVAGSLLALFIDPIAHSIGQTVLSSGTVLGWLTQLNDLPGFAWTRLNNTVVMGLATIGTLASIPVYLTAHALFRDTRSFERSDLHGNADSVGDYPVVHNPQLQES